MHHPACSPQFCHDRCLDCYQWCVNSHERCVDCYKRRIHRHKWFIGCHDWCTECLEWRIDSRERPAKLRYGHLYGHTDSRLLCHTYQPLNHHPAVLHDRLLDQYYLTLNETRKFAGRILFSFKSLEGSRLSVFDLVAPKTAYSFLYLVSSASPVTDIG